MTPFDLPGVIMEQLIMQKLGIKYGPGTLVPTYANPYQVAAALTANTLAWVRPGWSRRLDSVERDAL